MVTCIRHPDFIYICIYVRMFYICMYIKHNKQIKNVKKNIRITALDLCQ